MGVVYRALDTKLDRQVAVKVLREAAASDPRKIERFEREARAVARLSHPNILEIYDFGHEQGVTYAVMELLDGENLRDRLSGSKMPFKKVMQITQEMAEGLGAAHSQGVIHRDIKPENVFLTSEGRVKILDFGVAHLRETSPKEPGATAATEGLTETGTVVGTLTYMSPEQIRGAEVDAQSDIFSLGCVVYEMVAGRQAFRAETPADTVAAILQEDPEPLSTPRPEVPAALEQVVARCLEKRQEDRFESARDVAFSLKAMSDADMTAPRARHRGRSSRWTVRRTAIVVILAVIAIAAAGFGIRHLRARNVQLPDQKRLAVFDFQSVSQEIGQQQFAAGLTETVPDGLRLLEEQTHGNLWVVPRDLMGGPGPDQPVAMHREFNTNLSVTAKLEARDKEAVLTLSLVDCATGRTIRSTTIEDDPGNLAAFQEEPILRIAELLEIEPSGETVDRLTATATNVTAAFSPYIRGRGLLGGGGADLDVAIELLRQAVAADPLFGSAREALAEAYRRKFTATREPRWIEAGFEEANHVVARRPGASAYRVLASLHQAAGQDEQAIAALESATRASPASGEAFFELGQAYLEAERPEEARRALQRAINLRPGYWPGHSWLAYSYFVTGEYDAAANEFRQAIVCAPANHKLYNNLGGVLYSLGRFDEAHELFEKSIEVEPVDNYRAFSNLGTIHYYAARFADAAEMYARALDRDDTDYVIWGHLAFAYAYGAEPERAEVPFHRAIEIGNTTLQEDPENPVLLSDLASYYAMIGERDQSLELQESALALRPADSAVLATIGETFEVLGDRDRALEWIGRALQEGMTAAELEKRPTLRGLAADERYLNLVNLPEGGATEPGGGSSGSKAGE